ncbi:succinate dehydrogenase [Mycobacterium aquaticum]|uniref:Succinate dehydrogenase n=2 Tax=Mycobacterium aquaticum TaxID=1927124 RepID=A0A1X0ARL9_9MYCO|nr:succinate dehydrogenase [Mycobacterium aquaticum]
MDCVEQQVATSVLVIGAGGAALRAAIELAERGIDVLVVAKRPMSDAHTTLARGGVNAALATMDPEDCWQQHAADTLDESCLLADPITVSVVTEGAADAIRDLERYGMAFARERDGRISQRFFGAHTHRRTAYAGDHTGLELHRTLVHRTQELGVPVMDSVYITSLLVRDAVVFGAYGFDVHDGTRYTIHSDSVILATGGHARIWRRTSSRRGENTGDSFRLAHEAGARIRDAELVQFHPTGLIEPEEGAGTVVPDIARAEGGMLRNALGERFMRRYDKERMELSRSNHVAVAADTEIREGRGTPHGGVWLDLTHLPRTHILDRLPRLYQTLLDAQLLDIATDPIEVGPAAHYSMGGVWVYADDHSTDVAGLYVIGEASTGMHGAGMLGGNPLIELLVYGKIAARAAARYSMGLGAQQRCRSAVSHAREAIAGMLSSPGSENARYLQRAVRTTMTQRAGVVRDEVGLRAGLDEIDDIECLTSRLAVHPDIAGFFELAQAFDLRSALLAARATLETALQRRETRGCHNRSDYPQADESLRVNLVWSGPGSVAAEPVPAIPGGVSELMRPVSVIGKLLE